MSAHDYLVRLHRRTLHFKGEKDMICLERRCETFAKAVETAVSFGAKVSYSERIEAKGRTMWFPSRQKRFGGVSITPIKKADQEKREIEMTKRSTITIHPLTVAESLSEQNEKLGALMTQINLLLSLRSEGRECPESFWQDLAKTYSAAREALWPKGE